MAITLIEGDIRVETQYKFYVNLKKTKRQDTKLTDEITGETYPGTSGILFVSLPELSQENSPAGELASFLLGKLKTPKDKDVKAIAKTIKDSFNAFKADKEVKRTMTVAEKYKNEGIVEGRIEGEAKGRTEGEARGTAAGINLAVDQIQELVNSGLSLTEAINRVRSIAVSS